ncbi:MAG: winged helix-turn-helix domain-containing protein [Cyanobacteriota bacterium]|nr:winged helix-turn-helix domain-containing protein [Cyanobacteriota bacterium]
MTYPSQLLSDRQIYEYLWGEGEKARSNVLVAQVRLLRRRIEVNGELPLIYTVFDTLTVKSKIITGDSCFPDS